MLENLEFRRQIVLLYIIFETDSLLNSHVQLGWEIYGIGVLYINRAFAVTNEIFENIHVNIIAKITTLIFFYYKYN